MFRFIKEAIIALCLLVCGVDAAEATSNCYIRITPMPDKAAVNQVTNDLAKRDIRVAHRFAPDKVI